MYLKSLIDKKKMTTSELTSLPVKTFNKSYYFFSQFL